RKELVNVNEVLEDRIRELGQGVRDQVRLHLADDLPRIRGYRQKLSLALNNLLINALYAIRDTKGGRVDVATSRIADDSGDIRIEIADSGTGIRVEDLPRIFEPRFTTKP